jgi:hypothetical protein
MIKASEARELVKTSDMVADRLIKWIDPQVRKLAEEGKTSFDIYNDELMVRGEGYSAVLKETPIMLKVLERLKSFGYRTEFVTQKQEVSRRMLGCMDDEDTVANMPPSYFRYIRISW